MFEIRISFPFSRIFRLRRRRAVNTNEITGASYSGPQSNSRQPISSQPDPINLNSTPSSYRRSLYFSSLQSPVAQSSLPTSPAVTPPAGTPPPIIIIGRNSFEPTDPLPPAPAPPGDVGPLIPVNGVSLLPSPVAPKKRRVSFQLPIPDPEEDDRPSSRLSTCSTLVSESGTPAEGDFAPAVSQDYLPYRDAHESGGVGSTTPVRDGDALATEFLTVPGAVHSESVKARHKSFFAPQPVRVDMSRFSLPISPPAPLSRTENKRTSMMPITSGSGSTKKEKRTSRWSREMNKPETQEVLRAFQGF